MIKQKQIFNISVTAEGLVPDKFERINYVIVLVLTLFMSVLTTFLLHKLPTVIPLLFTMPWGEARLVPRIFLYVLPIIVFCLCVVNLGLGKIVLKLSPLLPKILAVTTAVVTIMLLIAQLTIIQSLIL